MAVIELDDGVHPQPTGERCQAVAIALSGGLTDLGMSGPEDQIAGKGLQVEEPRTSLDRPLEALAGTDQTPGEDEGSITRRT
jgi:hypothetical protein